MGSKKHARMNIIVWGLPKDGLCAEDVMWEGDHVTLILTQNDSRGCFSGAN